VSQDIVTAVIEAPVFSDCSNAGQLVAVTLVAKASFFASESNPALSSLEALKAALATVEKSGILAELEREVQNAFPPPPIRNRPKRKFGIFPRKVMAEEPAGEKVLNEDDVNKLADIVEAYDITESQGSIKFQRRVEPGRSE